MNYLRVCNIVNENPKIPSRYLVYSTKEESANTNKRIKKREGKRKEERMAELLSAGGEGVLQQESEKGSAFEIVRNDRLCFA